MIPTVDLVLVGSLYGRRILFLSAGMQRESLVSQNYSFLHMLSPPPSHTSQGVSSFLHTHTHTHTHTFRQRLIASSYAIYV